MHNTSPTIKGNEGTCVSGNLEGVKKNFPTGLGRN